MAADRGGRPSWQQGVRPWARLLAHACGRLRRQPARWCLPPTAARAATGAPPRATASRFRAPTGRAATTSPGLTPTRYSAAWRSKRTEEERWLYGRGASPAPFAGAGAVGGALMLTFFATLGACADPVAALTTGAPTFAFIAAQLATHFSVVAVVARGALRRRAAPLPPPGAEPGGLPVGRHL